MTALSEDQLDRTRQAAVRMLAQRGDAVYHLPAQFVHDLVVHVQSHALGDAYQQMVESTNAFFTRFMGEEGAPTTDAAELCFLEEVDEVSEALAEVVGGESPQYRLHLIEEMVDVMVTMIGILRSVGFSAEELSTGLEYVARKNDRKTVETHYLASDGKIRRLPQETPQCSSCGGDTVWVPGGGEGLPWGWSCVHCTRCGVTEPVQIIP